ncbi:urea ABC transporter permease subunit UrtB [Mangrovitalea sediminis]|uniref:urea ABC transporter permease subunit UrtB n=1 Tax=Mangrovitalea sediminis TaxID=1982043 RepID=UPI000BE4ECF8|nr:urea ABC transporter permease subunit UrtB [Mangrovitalea sediminis]
MNNRGWLALLLGVILSTAAASAWSDDFTTLATQLKSRDFNTKQQTIEALAKINDPRVLTIFKAMMGGQLFYNEDNSQPYLESEKNGERQFTSVLTGKQAEGMDPFSFHRVVVNNYLRGILRDHLAGLELSSPDEGLRLKAARQMLDDPEPDDMPRIGKALERETSPKVHRVLVLAQDLIRLQKDDSAVRLAAIAGLEGQLEPDVKDALVQLVGPDGKGGSEKDPKVRAAAWSALQGINTRLWWNGIFQNVYFGVSLGAVLLLAAVGLAITFGVMGVINMAHGEMIMLGAYTTYMVQQIWPGLIEYSVFIAIPLAFCVSGLVGVLLERLVIRHLYGRPLETLLATFGVSLALQQAVRTIFSPLNRSVITPDWMSGSFAVNGALSLTWNRLYIIIFALLVLLVLSVVLRKTQFGLQMRAVTQNRRMANSMGIRAGWVDALTFGLGSGIAGIAGVALSQLTNVGPNLGQDYIVDSFMVVVFGGVGNLMGTFFGAMTLGIANKLLEPFSGAVLAKIVVLVFIILFIQKRPRGLFALKGRAIED